MVTVDPLASLSIQDLDVTIGGRTYLMPGRSAADWLECLISGETSVVVPGWLDPAAENHVLDQMSDGLISVTEILDVTKGVISAAAGRPWWWALHLIGLATHDAHYWSRTNGVLVAAGVDPAKISLSAWLDAAYAAIVNRFTDNEQYDTFKLHIDTPPTVDLLDEEAESEAFMSMMG